LPVLTGPCYFNSQDIGDLLLAQGAALQVANAQDLAAILQRLLDDPGERQRIGSLGKRLVEANRGSVERLIALIEPSLPEAGPSAAAAPAHPSTEY
jgi:3-deoxy-D-manno-octulosonic-acid transferase